MTDEADPAGFVVEQEGLAAGIITKRNLWRTLPEAAPRHDALDVAELDRLIEGATLQFERIVEAHRRAAREAFGATRAAASRQAPE